VLSQASAKYLADQLIFSQDAGANFGYRSQGARNQAASENRVKDRHTFTGPR
jgi:hypothetical protein